MGLNKLNEYKKAKGYTNQQLADITGITLSTIDKITSGNNTNPKLTTLKALCDAVGCTLNDLSDYPSKTTDENFIFTVSEKEIIKKYRILDKYGKKAVDNLLDTEYERCQTEKNINSKDEYVTVLTAARSSDNRPIEFQKNFKRKT